MTRRRSLFWIVAGAFVVTALLGTLVQGFIAQAVLGPLESRDARTRAELLVSRLENEIAPMSSSPGGSEMESLLTRARQESGLRFTSLLYRGRDGLVVAVPSERARDIVAGYQGLQAPTGRDSANPASGRRRFDLLARRSLSHHGSPVGEIAVLRFARSRGAGPWALSSRALLLAVPVAVFTSLLVALVMVRLLVRRLRSLEVLAARVAEGDLSVRVDDRSGDEIGRLAERLDGMTERLAEQRDHLEQHELQRRQLFADITHELATPLTSIRGYTETLLNPAVAVSDEERGRYLQGMLAESRRLDRLIRDLFELARLEAGASPLQLEALDWVALCRHTLERFEPRFRQAGLSLVWSDSTAEAWIEADGHRMEQVLENLLANALRYVPSGGRVELSLQRVGGEAGDRFRMTIADDGPGMAEEEIPHLFERFYRSPSTRGMSSTSGVGGSGLGLAIVREIVQRHGGTVRATARAPQGLAIEVEIPASGREPRVAA